MLYVIYYILNGKNLVIVRYNETQWKFLRYMFTHHRQKYFFMHFAEFVTKLIIRGYIIDRYYIIDRIISIYILYPLKYAQYISHIC